MLAQIQEMLYIEKGGDEQLNDELSAYNPLIPKGKEFVATLMFEIDNPISRADFLSKIGGIEKKIFIQIQNEKVNATAEQDIERTSEEGKASSVHFLHFIFTENQSALPRLWCAPTEKCDILFISYGFVDSKSKRLAAIDKTSIRKCVILNRDYGYF